MTPYRGFLLSLLLGLRTVEANSCKNAPAPISYSQGGPLQNSQNLTSSPFIGKPTHDKPLKPRFKYYPDVSVIHTDGGNTGSSDNPGPLGMSPNITSTTNPINIMIWGPDGSLTAGYANITEGNPPPRGLVAVDPTTLDILAAWYPPVNETIGFAYMSYVQKTNDVLLSTKEGHIYVVHRDICKGVPYFTTIRTIPLKDELLPGEGLLNSQFDTAGNIWFTSGGLLGAGDEQQNSTTYGYITPGGEISKVHMENEFVENGLAISGMNVFMNTSPAGKADHANATGYMYSLTSEGYGGIKIRWKVPYEAGSRSKGRPNSVTSRGSGTTPSLLTDKYVAITDNADRQIHLNVYHQEAKGSKAQQLLCQVPLFTPGNSQNVNAIINHFDGETYGMMVQNFVGSPPLFIAQPGKQVNVNGRFNDMSKMHGMQRIDIDADGKCKLRWSKDYAVKAVSILSTSTGLLYSYVQNTERSPKGQYIWYVAGIDWNTGETVFKIRTGTGGVYNDNWAEGTLSPDGTFYQAVLGGLVSVKDGR